MTSENWKLEKDLCRCCHSEGSFKNLSVPSKNLGTDEIYSDMLKECFDIDMAPVPGLLCAATYTICELCVTRLRDATEFKKQVQTCEERFRNMYERNVIRVSDSSIIDVDVKQEVPDTYQDDDFTEDISQDDHNEDFDESIEIEIEEQDDKPDEEDEEKRKKKKKLKSKKTEKKSLRRTERKKVKQETGEENDTSKKKGRPPPKYRLKREDYIIDDDHRYQCIRCSKSYSSRCSLRYHVRVTHYNVLHDCSICNEGFTSPVRLVNHKLEVHNIDERFKCNACKAAFNKNAQLKNHIQNFHMLGERYNCEFCNYESFSQQNLMKHKFKHNNVKSFHCSFCKKSFSRKRNLVLHERIHTGDKRKVCTVCEKAFVQKASLNYHMTKYHPEVNF